MDRLLKWSLLFAVAVLGANHFTHHQRLQDLQMDNYELAVSLDNLQAEQEYGARVTDLPEDGGLWHLVVIAETPQQLSQYRKWFADEPALSNLLLQKQCHSHFMHTKDSIYTRHYANTYTAPSIYLLRSDGKVAYGAKGALVPTTAKVLVKVLKWGIERFICPNCPKPKPVVPVDPTTPSPQDTPPVIVPDTADKTNLMNLLLALLAAAGIGGGAELVDKFKKGTA